MAEAQSSDGTVVGAARMLIVADDREEGSGVVESLRAVPQLEVVVRRLVLGDYLVDGRTLFERKTLPDFAASIVSGRLFRQAMRLTRSEYPVALILEGRSGDLAQCHVSREAMQGALVSLSLIFRLPILRAFDGSETARLLAYAGDQVRRHQEEGGLRPGTRPKGKRRRQLHILQGLPGVGAHRAARLLDAFGSVEAVMKAEPGALQEVEGVGSKTAEAIRAILQEQPPPYGSTSPRVPDV